MVDRKRRGHRRSAADRDAARCENRPIGRGLVAANRFSSPTPVRRHSAVGRQRPGAIYVDSTGRRFCNESNSYVEVGKAMYANKAVPCWQIFDEGYVGRYVSGANPLEATSAGSADRAGCHQAGQLHRRPGTPNRRSPQTNWSTRSSASTSSPRRASTPLSAAASPHTTTASAIPGYRPNAAIGPLDRAPYYATKIYPSDVGTCGGVITNEHAQVLDENDLAIHGLYATGNITATVMGERIRAQAQALRTPWCSAMSRRATRRAARSPARKAASRAHIEICTRAVGRRGSRPSCRTRGRRRAF